LKEQEHHKKAFEYYYSLGEKRNFKQVAEELKVSIGSVKLWSQTFNWKRKLRERDASAAREIAARVIDDEVSSRNRNKQIVHMALVQLAKAIAEGKVRMTLSDLDKLIRLEGFLNEKPKQALNPLYHGLIESLTTDKTDEEMLDDLKDNLRVLGYELVEKNHGQPPPAATEDCEDNHDFRDNNDDSKFS
jgi:transposase